MPKGNNKMIKKEPKNYFQRGLGALKTPQNGKIGASGGVLLTSTKNVCQFLVDFWIRWPPRKVY